MTRETVDVSFWENVEGDSLYTGDGGAEQLLVCQKRLSDRRRTASVDARPGVTADPLPQPRDQPRRPPPPSGNITEDDEASESLEEAFVRNNTTSKVQVRKTDFFFYKIVTAACSR